MYRTFLQGIEIQKEHSHSKFWEDKNCNDCEFLISTHLLLFHYAQSLLDLHE